MTFIIILHEKKLRTDFLKLSEKFFHLFCCKVDVAAGLCPAATTAKRRLQQSDFIHFLAVRTIVDDLADEIHSLSTSENAPECLTWKHIAGMMVRNPLSRVIDHSVAEAWKMYNLNYQLQQIWLQIAPMLDGQLTVTNGMMDIHYLNEATHLLQEFIESADPPADVKFDYGFRQPHCSISESPNNPGQEMTNPEFIRSAMKAKVPCLTTPLSRRERGRG